MSWPHGHTDIENGLRILGAERRRMGEEALEHLSIEEARFAAVARDVARKIADDFVHDNTGLCDRCDGEAYQHAVADLTAMLTDHIAADLAEGTRIWLETRKVGES